MKGADLPHPAKAAATPRGRQGMTPIGPANAFRTPPYNDSFPSTCVKVARFWIDPTEVTTAMYAQFVRDTGYMPPASWKDGWYEEGRESLPVTGASFVDAVWYCAWRGARLPTDHEWELAAHGTDGRRFPWGNKPDPKAFCAEVPLKPVGSFPKSAGPHGLHDIVGNAWEWTCSAMRTDVERKVIQSSALIFGGGTLKLDQCLHFKTGAKGETGLLFQSMFGRSPLMVFWDQRSGLPSGGGFNSRMWGAYITSPEFSYYSIGSGSIAFGTGGVPRSYPDVCILSGDLSFRCETVGFRCAAE